MFSMDPTRDLPPKVLLGLQALGEVPALEALSDFQRSDMNVVKNKTAYLAGVIQKRVARQR